MNTTPAHHHDSHLVPALLTWKAGRIMTVVSELQELLAPLLVSGADEDVFAWVASEHEGTPAQRLHAELGRLGFLPEQGQGVVVTPEKIGERLLRIDGEHVMPLMVRICTTNLAYSAGGFWTEATARPILRDVMRLLGPQAEWWTNSRPGAGAVTSWSSVTHHTFDCVVIGVGNGATIGLLAVAED